MEINHLLPLSGKILVEPLPDEKTTKSGIILPKHQPINKQCVAARVIAVGKNISEDIRIKIEVKPGDICLLGRVSYDTIRIENKDYWIVNAADTLVVIESEGE